MRPASDHQQNGQALVELAVVLPVLVGMVTVLFQLGLLLVIYLSLVHATRDVGRWLAVHPDTTDAQLRAYVNTDMPTTIAATAVTVTATPACASLSSGHCALRLAGSALHIHVSYDATGNVFLPTNFAIGWFKVRVPVVLPPYDYYVMIEQA
jgi:Flp pilus assembly protein TadG